MLERHFGAEVAIEMDVLHTQAYVFGKPGTTSDRRDGLLQQG